jgi:Protein of unknown function (DUF4239)
MSENPLKRGTSSVNLYWVYDLPNWLFATLVMGTFTSIALVGQRLTQRWVRRVAGNDGKYNDLVSTTLATVGVFFGITLGLISVGTWQNYADIDANVNQEAATVAALYSSVSNYPEPANTSLRNGLRDYTKYLIDEAWPQQRKGIVPQGGAARIADIQSTLLRVNPVLQGHISLHAETISRFNDLLKERRLRLQSVTGGLPDTLWAVVIFGALLNIFIPWFLVYDRQFIQDLMIALMATTIGLLVFLMAAMDNPFRGEFSVSPGAFELIYQLMK